MICWCCLSEEAREKKKISDEIDKILMEEEKNLRKEFKLLLLGGFIWNINKIKVWLCLQFEVMRACYERLLYLSMN
jgi:hypothetical protein